MPEYNFAKCQQSFSFKNTHTIKIKHLYNKQRHAQQMAASSHDGGSSFRIAAVDNAILGERQLMEV